MAGVRGVGGTVLGSDAVGMCSATLLGSVLVRVRVRVAVLLVAVFMVVAAGAVIVAMSSEHNKSYQVGGKADGAHDDHEQRVRDIGRVEESGDGFEED
jgi:hypothetical protein